MSSTNKIIFKKNQVNSRINIIKIFKNPKLAKIVNNLRKRNEIVNQFQQYNKGGITKNETRKILGKFYYDGSDSLNKSSTAQLAKAFGISGAHKYERPEVEYRRRFIKIDKVNSEKMDMSEKSKASLLQEKFKNKEVSNFSKDLNQNRSSIKNFSKSNYLYF